VSRCPWSPTQLIGNDTVSVAGKTPDGRDSVGLKVGQVVPVVMGDGNPDYTIGFGNDFRWKALSASILIDRQQGGMLAAGTWRHYDLGGNSRDYDVITPSGERLGDQRVRVYRNVTRVYYQDASFTKLREVTLGARIPRSWLSRVRGMNGVTGAEFTLSGRNLFWWTPYRGGDPEFFAEIWQDAPPLVTAQVRDLWELGLRPGDRVLSPPTTTAPPRSGRAGRWRCSAPRR